MSASDKARAKAVKAGYPVGDALAVGREFWDDQESYLAVFGDRVDVFRKPKFGRLLDGAGVESYPLASVTSVSVRQDGIWSVLTFTASGVVVEFRGAISAVPPLREAIMAAKATV